MLFFSHLFIFKNKQPFFMKLNEIFVLLLLVDLLYLGQSCSIKKKKANTQNVNECKQRYEWNRLKNKLFPISISEFGEMAMYTRLHIPASAFFFFKYIVQYQFPD